MHEHASSQPPLQADLLSVLPATQLTLSVMRGPMDHAVANHPVLSEYGHPKRRAQRRAITPPRVRCGITTRTFQRAAALAALPARFGTGTAVPQLGTSTTGGARRAIVVGPTRVRGHGGMVEVSIAQSRFSAPTFSPAPRSSSSSAPIRTSREQVCVALDYVVRPNGASHQWREDPPRELLV